MPPGWRVVAVDGSHVDVDRHLPAACFLVNLGGCILTYGPRPDAAFFSQPRLSDESDLHLADPANPSQEEAVTGALLGLMRTVEELERLAEESARSRPASPRWPWLTAPWFCGDYPARGTAPSSATR